MKKICLLSLTLWICADVLAQSGKNVPPPVKNNAHLKVFNLAKTSGDVPTGIAALNYYIAELGTETPYMDTLAMLYMQQGAFSQCYYWSDRRLKDNPEDNGLMEMKAVCLDKLQQPKESISIFEKLYARTKSPFHAYKLMELQYSIKRLEECLVTAMSAEKLQFKPEYVMSYNAGEQVGRTYLQAGIFNIHALALYDLNKKAEAKAYFEKALALDSNFLLPRQNLEAIKTIEAGGNKNNLNNQPPPNTNPANKNN